MTEPRSAVASVVAMLLTSGALAQANELNGKLLALSEDARHAALTELVRQGGEDCDAVVRSMLRHAAASEPAFWNAGCRNRKAFWVVISPDPGQRPLVLDCESSKTFDKMLADMARRAGQQPGPPLECSKMF